MCRFVSISIAALALCLSVCECTSGGHQEQPAKAPYPSKAISSPNWPKSYPKNAMVRMEEAANYGTKLGIVFEQLELEVSAPCYDYILIYIDVEPPIELCNRSSIYNTKLCGGHALPTFVADRFALDFCSDHSVQHSGFTATVSHLADTTTELVCGQPVHKPSLAVGPNGIDAMVDSGGGEATDIGDHGNTVLIRGGVVAEPHSYPWQASFQVWIKRAEPEKDDKYFCGGSLISAQWVLTAAHCVWDTKMYGAIDAADITLYLGVHDQREIKWNVAVQRMDVEWVVVHDFYNHANLTAGYDIALLQLSKEAKFTGSVQPICLPSAEDSWRKDGGYVVATGWGKTEWGAYAKRLRQVMMPCNVSACVARGYSEKTMCTNLPMELTGSGDSGGPLIGRRDGRYVLAGITSGGTEPWTPGKSGLSFYTHVPSYMHWIEEHVWGRDKH